MKGAYQTFLRGASVNNISKAGVVLVTSSVLIFFVFELFQFTGMLQNAYIGLITYAGFPVLFLLGLFLIPLGWWIHAKSRNITFSALIKSRFKEEELAGREFGARLFRTITLLTLANFVILGFASTMMLHYMDEAHFCGTACHSVMNPEWTTYQESPHARVQCVECHVGDGIKATINAKFNGMWQMISATFNLYEKPIPTPVHNLRPARETCEKCHWPEKFLGNRVVNRVHYDFDENSTPKYTTLMMKVGSGGYGMEAAGIHWHVSEENEVRYMPADEKREEILWLEVKQKDGTFKKYTNTKLDAGSGHEKIRLMDCVDCHNRATHIYEVPEYAVDDRMWHDKIPHDLPFVKKAVYAAVTASYPDKKSGLEGIEAYLRNYYQRNHPEVFKTRLSDIQATAEVARDIYNRNIHPGMNIEWGSYPTHLGHRDGKGCFRCHNPYMKDAKGLSISMDCTLCHSIMAIEEDSPFKYIKGLEKSDSLKSQKDMHKYLGDEFWQSTRQ